MARFEYDGRDMDWVFKLVILLIIIGTIIAAFDLHKHRMM